MFDRDGVTKMVEIKMYPSEWDEVQVRAEELNCDLSKVFRWSFHDSQRIHELRNTNQSLAHLSVSFMSGFLWWYFDHYDLELDPYGRWGIKAERVMLTHMKLTGKRVDQEFVHFILHFQKYQDDYDMCGNMVWDSKNNQSYFDDPYVMKYQEDVKSTVCHCGERWKDSEFMHGLCPTCRDKY